MTSPTNPHDKFFRSSMQNIINIQQFVHDAKTLPENVKGEIMTAAEKLQAIGEKVSLEKGLETSAINALKEGLDPRMVERITGLDISVIQKLKERIEDSQD